MKLLVTGAFSWTKEQLQRFKDLGHETIFIQDERVPLEIQSIDPADIEGVICNSLFLYTNIEKFTNLRYVQLTSAGYDRVPIDYIQKRGIAIFNAKGVYSIPMAEFSVCGVLQLYKQSRFFYENQRLCKWEKHRGLMELTDKNICIVGCGSVGVECAKRFATFGCEITGVDIQPFESNVFNRIYPIQELHKLLPENDIVILTLPLTERTRAMVDARFFNAMKRSAVLVNIARGAIIDESAMIEALQTKEIFGAVLDVFCEEPLSEKSRLWNMNNVIITPHNSFISEKTNARLVHLIYTNLKDYSVKG